MTVQKEQQITVELSPEFAMHVAERILTAMGARISSKSSNAIVAHKGISPKSWGEDITISLISSGTGGSVIKIKSVSSLKTTLIDWGANVNNVETIVQTYKDVGTLINKAMQSKLVCPICGQELPPGTQFCPNDGTAITVSRPNSGSS